MKKFFTLIAFVALSATVVMADEAVTYTLNFTKKSNITLMDYTVEEDNAGLHWYCWDMKSDDGLDSVSIFVWSTNLIDTVINDSVAYWDDLTFIRYKLSATESEYRYAGTVTVDQLTLLSGKVVAGAKEGEYVADYSFTNLDADTIWNIHIEYHDDDPEPSPVENVTEDNLPQNRVKVEKFMINGQMYIKRDDIIFDAQGRIVK